MTTTKQELEVLGQREQRELELWLAGELVDDDGPCCQVCDALGHSAGEFGELCPAVAPRGWFEPSDPRDLGELEF